MEDSTDEIESDIDKRNKKKFDNNNNAKSNLNENETKNENLNNVKKPSKWSSFWKRFISTWTMIFSFFGLLWFGHYAVALFISFLQALMFREIANLSIKPRYEQQLPGFHLLHWYLFFASIFFMYGHTLLEYISIEFTIHNKIYLYFLKMLFNHHGFISFSLTCVGLVTFVLSLKKGYYKYQFKQLAWCLVIIVIVVTQSTFAIINMFDGLVWLLLPAFCIVTNDIWAYMCGISCGKTQLIRISPNKTWEGAIGGGFFTLIFAYLFAEFFIHFEFFYCPKRDLTWDYPTCADHKDIVFFRQYSMPSYVINTISYLFHVSKESEFFRYSSFHLHSLVFALFASVIGPFGGFFASGFKRAFKIKDFGDSIPGHGGIADRMDCQVLMCCFVFVYRRSFVRPFILSVEQIIHHAMLLPKDDLLRLSTALAKSLSECQIS